jgi:hypothetical protein
MKRTQGKKTIVLLVALVVLGVLILVIQGQAGQQPISAFGRYQGYTETLYDGMQRTSDYLTLSDGTRLAYDLILPRIRVTIACADADNFATPVLNPAPMLELLRNSSQASYVDIPVVR